MKVGRRRTVAREIRNDVVGVPDPPRVTGPVGRNGRDQTRQQCFVLDAPDHQHFQGKDGSGERRSEDAVEIRTLVAQGELREAHREKMIPGRKPAQPPHPVVLGDDSFGISNGGLYVHNDFIKKYPELTQDIVDATVKATEFVIKDKNAWIDRVRQFTGQHVRAEAF